MLSVGNIIECSRKTIIFPHIQDFTFFIEKYLNWKLSWVIFLLIKYADVSKNEIRKIGMFKYLKVLWKMFMSTNS